MILTCKDDEQEERCSEEGKMNKVICGQGCSQRLGITNVSVVFL